MKNMKSDMLESLGIDAIIYTPEVRENALSSLFSKVEGLKTQSDVRISEYLEKKGNGRFNVLCKAIMKIDTVCRFLGKIMGIYH